MIVRESTDQIVWEMFFEACCKIDQEFVSLIKSVGAIEQFHSDDVKEDDSRGSAHLDDIFFVMTAANASIFLVRKPGQRVKVTVSVFTDSQEYGFLAVPGNLGYAHNQVFPGAGAPDNEFTLFKNFVKRNLGEFLFAEEIIL